MAVKSISIPEDKFTQITELAERLGYQSGKNGGIEKQLINDIMDAILDNEACIHSESNIREFLSRGIKTTKNMNNRVPTRSNTALEKLEGLIEKYASEGTKKTKSYYQKTHRVNYQFMTEYEKNHPGVFSESRLTK